MTQHSTQATSTPPGNSLWGRLPNGPWPVRLILLAALLLAVPFLFHADAKVHAADNEITGVTVTSLNPGELVITWDAPSRAPGDYRVTWKKSDGKWPSYKNANTALGGNAFPTGTSHTVSDLEEGTEYSVRVRARYHDGGGNITESGPWSDPPVGLTIAGLPAKPTGLSASPSHDTVLLSWTDPGDGTVTGYQVLRGPDAANLAVLTADTGSAASRYTDDTVEAQTTYVYAIKARNAHGLGPQSDTVSATTPAAPVLPAKPTGLSTSPSHNSVDLSWTDPGDSSITSYQVLRGPDKDNLAVLVDNTGNSSLSYTDSTVAAETSYVYAIKARNSDGLSPESDPVSTTTPAAPVEAPAAEQLPRASFTLDGQALDTSGTCSDDHIASVADDCTIDITTKSPVFAVDGTVDSDDRIGIRTGRDLAAALAATEVAGESELRGEDRTVTLTLPEGRSLLRLWDDEDGESGGEQASFFRINVLPYWQWDSQLLSKDSACQSASDRSLADITDSDCIVTQSGNTGSIRFHNVTTEQFNVYVSVNGSEVIREPDAAALGGPFTVDTPGQRQPAQGQAGQQGEYPRGGKLRQQRVLLQDHDPKPTGQAQDYRRWRHPFQRPTGLGRPERRQHHRLPDPARQRCRFADRPGRRHRQRGHPLHRRHRCGRDGVLLLHPGPKRRGARPPVGHGFRHDAGGAG